MFVLPLLLHYFFSKMKLGFRRYPLILGKIEGFEIPGPHLDPPPPSTIYRGGANSGSGGAPALPTTVGPMEPLLSSSYNLFFAMNALRGEIKIVYSWK